MKDRITLGQITSAVGIKGEMRVYPYTDYMERFSEIEKLQIEEKEYAIERVSYRKNMVILKLKGIEDRNLAEEQKGKKLYLNKEDMWEIPEDTYFVFDLLGLTVLNESNETIGVVTDVIQNSAQDIYQIKMKNGKQFLLPAVKEFILSVNIEEKTMIVRLIEGLVEL
ncbi:ribosome maturation factor RimM [Anaerovorax sp. IOR16]|uniref:ribosome maturation factor RimM n=1 Tax=Anaerovorax sp. IOR16 TaxID=2773458 RepID=UPI0019CFBB1D|nr:ribosome maturation factor RimM [Anaerovorax sp. IOR16]